MKEKTPEKSRQLAKADLNFISQKPLENIIKVIQSRKNAHITPEIFWMNSDTALFRLTYSRDTRTTAEVRGRLQRWAGDMTHIYCDGRIFRTKISYLSSFIRWVWLLALIAPAILCALFVITHHTGFIAPFIYSMLILIFVGFMTAMGTLVPRWMRALRQQSSNFQKDLAKPEQKDRERLLHFLTEIVRDDDFHEMLEAVEALSDEEIAVILERADGTAKSKR